MAPLKAVLFDLDGTLVDSAEDLAEALNDLLASEGLRALHGREVRAMIGDGALTLVERGLARTGGDAGRAGELLPRFLNCTGRAHRARHGLIPGSCRHDTAYMITGCVSPS